ncbi:MAG: hypothetical protein M1826_002247 [Phylliscum demangeonii]|nr:MAG: hypothetical protein M1826_002247 [Phylliscum demangeonii]
MPEMFAERQRWLQWDGGGAWEVVKLQWDWKLQSKLDEWGEYLFFCNRTIDSLKRELRFLRGKSAQPPDPELSEISRWLKARVKHVEIDAHLALQVFVKKQFHLMIKDRADRDALEVSLPSKSSPARREPDSRRTSSRVRNDSLAESSEVLQQGEGQGSEMKTEKEQEKAKEEGEAEEERQRQQQEQRSLSADALLTPFSLSSTVVLKTKPPPPVDGPAKSAESRAGMPFLSLARKDALDQTPHPYRRNGTPQTSKVVPFAFHCSAQVLPVMRGSTSCRDLSIGHVHGSGYIQSVKRKAPSSVWRRGYRW